MTLTEFRKRAEDRKNYSCVDLLFYATVFNSFFSSVHASKPVKTKCLLTKCPEGTLFLFILYL